MSENRSRYVLLCQQALACAVVLAVATPAIGVVTLDIVAPPSEGATAAAVATAGALVASEPVEPDVLEVPITETAGQEAAARKNDPDGGPTVPSAGETAGAESTVTAPQPVTGFASVGVTWDNGDPVAQSDIAVTVRSLKDGEWSDWEELPYEADGGPDPHSDEALRARPGTNAVVVGDVDDVQVKVVSDEGELPADMRLSIIDPGATAGAVVEQPAIDTARLASAGFPTTTDETTPAPTPTPAPTDPAAPVAPVAPVEAPALAPVANVVAPQPEIFSRAQWGADERMRDKSSLHYGTIHAGFVHHTVNANDYTRAQVPAIIRGIYAYHTQSRGWSDIGYNFLVDKFGRIWEGRYGGVDRPVVGAHTLGYNEESFAMSAIGNFETAQPTPEMLDAYGRLFAWKLSLHGVDAAATSVKVDGDTFQAINGHRDAAATACPGKYLYAKIPTIRTLAKQYQGPITTTPLDTDMSGSTWPDFVVRDQATQQAFVVRTGGQVGFRGPKRAAAGFDKMDMVVATRDLDGDGLPDVLARNRSTKSTALYKGDGAGHVSGAVRTYSRFSGLDMMIGVGDLDHDGTNDVVGRKAETKRLLLYRGKGNGAFKKTKRLAATWDYGLTSAAGDFNGDGNADLVARDADKRLWLVPGDAASGLGTPVQLPRKWGAYDVIAGLGDLTNDGRPDLLARTRSSGRTFIYPGNGTGGFGYRLGGFSRFAGVDFLAPGGPLAGPGDDLVGRNAKGKLVTFANREGHNVEAVVPTGSVLSDTDVVLNVGDWNRDGFNDVITRAVSDGNLYLRPGNGADGFAAPVLAGTGFAGVAQLTPVGDITGDGYPDLTGTPAGAAPRIYPGNGSTGFLSSYPGSGPAKLARTGDTTRYDWWFPLGDVDGDRRADVLVRAKGSGKLWLLPGIKGGFDKRRFVAPGFGGYDLAG
jgi:uncharacterized protein with LGFP repeats